MRERYNGKCICIQCLICQGEPPLVDNDPPLVTAKFGLAGRIWPIRKCPKSKFVIKSLWTKVRHYSDPSPKTFL